MVPSLGPPKAVPSTERAQGLTVLCHNLDVAGQLCRCAGACIVVLWTRAFVRQAPLFSGNCSCRPRLGPGDTGQALWAHPGWSAVICPLDVPVCTPPSPLPVPMMAVFAGSGQGSCERLRQQEALLVNLFSGCYWAQ